MWVRLDLSLIQQLWMYWGRGGANCSVSKSVPPFDIGLLWLLEFRLRFTFICFSTFSTIKRWSFLYNYELLLEWSMTHWPAWTVTHDLLSLNELMNEINLFLTRHMSDPCQCTLLQDYADKDRIEKVWLHISFLPYFGAVASYITYKCVGQLNFHLHRCYQRG